MQSVCYEDMRLGPDRPFLFSPNSNSDSVLITPKHGLTIPLGPVILEQDNTEYSLSIGKVLRLNSSSQISSSHDLAGIEIFGEEGVVLVHLVNLTQLLGKDRVGHFLYQ